MVNFNITFGTENDVACTEESFVRLNTFDQTIVGETDEYGAEINDEKSYQNNEELDQIEKSPENDNEENEAGPSDYTTNKIEIKFLMNDEESEHNKNNSIENSRINKEVKNTNEKDDIEEQTQEIVEFEPTNNIFNEEPNQEASEVESKNNQNFSEESKQEVDGLEPTNSQAFVEKPNKELIEPEITNSQIFVQEPIEVVTEFMPTFNQDPIDSPDQVITEIFDNQIEINIGNAQIFDSNVSNLMQDEENKGLDATFEKSDVSKDDSRTDLEEIDINKKMEERLKKYGEQDLNYQLELQQLDDNINRHIDNQSSDDKGMFGSITNKIKNLLSCKKE